MRNSRVFLIKVLCLASLLPAQAGTEPSKAEVGRDPEGGEGASLPKEIRERLSLLRPGLTRAELEKNFERDGGLYSPLSQRYYLRGVMWNSKVIMVSLTFQPQTMPDAVYRKSETRNQWALDHEAFFSGETPESREEYYGSPWVSPKDVLREIGQPYFSGIAID